MNEQTGSRPRPLLSRREFLGASLASSAAVVAGCATNPVTGERQFMLISEAEEVAMDQKWAPHQISSDYGAVQDAALNAYVSEIGLGMARLTQRPAMPYSFRFVNSVVANAYTMPAGTTAVTRGLALTMENESQLAGVLGHEIGHVCARHAGERMSKALLAQLLVAGATLALERDKKGYGQIAAGLGSIGASMLLSRYSRDDERQADELGMGYMVKAGYNPRGMADLMAAFMKMKERDPSAVELLFATHPMSSERYATAVEAIRTRYAGAAGLRADRERYMDRTAGLRAMRKAIEGLQKGEQALMAKKVPEAEGHLRGALQQAPRDYAGLLLMAKCCVAAKDAARARQYVEEAKRVYPGEPQAVHLSGLTLGMLGRFDAAYAEFDTYERALPGNANTIYYKGLTRESAGARADAAREYQRYLAAEPEGEHAGHATQRLTQWGYLKPPAAEAAPGKAPRTDARKQKSKGAGARTRP